mgnify:CR=1 FL=1
MSQARSNPALRLLAWLAILSDRSEPNSPRAELETPALGGAFEAARDLRAAQQQAGQS